MLRRQILGRWYSPLFTLTPWRETLHLLADLPLGIAWFTIAITLLSVSAGMAITIVGLPLLAVTVLVGRWFGAIDRARSRALLGDDPLAPVPFRIDGTPWQKFRNAMSDVPGWKGLLYGLVMLPVGIATFTIAVVTWSLAIGLTTLPTYAWALPESAESGQFRFSDSYVLYGWGRVGASIATGVVGLLLLALAPRIIHALARGDRWLIRTLLSPSPEALLASRVSQLERSRDASVDSAAGELRRIERDLHDGAQQRLVSLAMNLGIAKDRLGADQDPHTVELVTRAHDEAKQAIGELRDLVRGIHPAVLTDRGLDAAVSALAARCPVAVQVQSNLGRRLPPAVEATGYFVVAEALTNIAKHSRATRASVTLAERDGRLTIQIFDDGVGGIVEDGSGGLRGLRDRVTSVEGQLRIASPIGGPTTIIVEVPCGS
jgi:signal transduction histidine kinase